MSSTVKIAASLLIALASLGLGPTVADAANLVKNGRFDDTSAWGELNPSFTFDTQDLTGWEPSGSGRLVNSRPVVSPSFYSNLTTEGQRVPVVPGRTYTFRARYLIPAGQQRTGSAVLYVLAVENADCTGDVDVLGLTQGTVIGRVQSIDQQVTMPDDHHCASVILGVLKNEAGGSFAVLFDDVFLGTPCGTDANTLCLSGARFEVKANWRSQNGQEGKAFVHQLTNDTGYLFFLNPANVEAVVKILNGCGITQRYWVFSGGLTNSRVEITVTDSETGVSKTYVNPLGKPFQPIQDTAALAACP